MSGKLSFIATTGLIGAAVLLAVGAGLSGRDLAGIREIVGADPVCGPATSDQSQVTLPLLSSNRLLIALPATIRYQPGDKAEVVVRGDPALVSHVRLDGYKLSLDCDRGWHSSRLEVDVSGPAIAEWTLLGSGDLTMAEIDQPRLRLSIRGSGSVAADGAANEVEVDIAGSGEARLKSLVAQTARITIRGSGDAEVYAQKEVDVSISGSGDVELSGNPVLRSSNIKGSGRIRQTT